MAAHDIDLARLKALDERRRAGADAWSPSRAREALRGYLYTVPTAALILQEAEDHGAFSDEQRFDDWCFNEFGLAIAT